ncbi:MAG: class I adenylate-forming enzyme family protein [Luteolibacter sp.]
MNIVAQIRKQNHATLPAIISGSRETSFTDLFSAVDEIRTHLEKLPCFGKPVRPRIGVIFPNGTAYIAVALAVLDAGACFVPIPDELTPAERETLIRQTALDCLISADETGLPLPLDLGHAKITLLSPPNPTFPEADFEALNPAFIRFSSGTTGTSKGVLLSHQSLLDRILAANQGLALSPGDRVLWTLPMAHHFAVTIILYLYHGVATILENTHHPDLLYRAARDSRTNLLYGSPFHFAQLAQCAEAAPLPHLRRAISTASALTADVARAFQEKFHLPLTQALGIIEIGLPILNTEHPSTHPTALGQPLPAYTVKTTPEGELLISGPGLFDAYLTPWQPRKTLLQDSFFPTGDLVDISDDNTITLLGRSKSVINVGGMKVFPEEIEAVLNTHPSIEKSRVFPEDHPTLGSFPCAEAIFQENTAPPTMRDLRLFCKDRLAPYKIPMRLTPVKSIRLTASGKVKRA